MQISHLKCLGSLLVLVLVLPITSFGLQSSPVLMNQQVASLSADSIQREDYSPNEMKSLFGLPVLSEADYVPPSVSGVLDPALVEQSGISTTGNLSARTDTMANTQQTLTIDTAHDWAASSANLDLWNLKKTYAENGTFDDGYPGTNMNPTGSVSYHPLGWDAISTSTDPAQTQIASYSLGTESYVVVENQGTPVPPASDPDYLHSAGTSISWVQGVNNVPYSENFVLRFRYLYFRGPIGSVPIGNCSIAVYLDGTLVWNASLLLIEQHGVWLDSGNIAISQPGIGSSFEIEIGLSIDGDMTLDPKTDYDGDSYLDGIQNTLYITAFLDDVSLISASSPTCGEVGLEFSIDGSTAQIDGTLGTGSGQILNPSFWKTSSLSFSIQSNTSVSFDYRVNLLNHRFLNSTWTTDTQRQGASYTIESGRSGELSIFTYIGFLGVYEDLAITLTHPSDWENFTVFDPFLSDVSSSCLFDSQTIIIPDNILDRLGWWKVTCEAPNYASSASVERYISETHDWVNESVFHSNDSARLSVSLSTKTEIPTLSNPVNFTWFLPNTTSWSESSTSGGMKENTSSPTVTFGPINTTAGMWGVRYVWSNGSELAYDSEVFALHHIAVIESVYSNTLETLVGQPVSVFLRFLDAENGLYILNDGATVVGNWSSGDVVFTADIVKNWWQADFDTGTLGPGDYTISIVSAAPYFETVPLLITIKAQALANLDSPAGPLTPLVYGRHYSYDFFYSMSHNGTGIDGATVNITEDGSEWSSIENTGNGHYNLSLAPMGAGDYSIRITFSKVGYETESHVMSFLVDPVPIEVESISSLVGLELTNLEVEVHIIESDTGNPVTGANVTLGVYRPGAVIYFYSEMEEVGSGNYKVTISMPASDTGTYSVRISVEKANHEMIQSFNGALVPTFDSNVRLMQTLLRYSWQISLGAIIIFGGVAVQRVRSKRKREKHTEAVLIKNRINDANNVLGFLVLHKLSGVPIYSHVFKGGFEETILSAFISAIMHFRKEFETTEAHDESTIIPISEVIRVVPTENLICAFISVTSPSIEQEAKMKSYARAIGMMFDDALAEVSVEAIDEKVSRTFELMFDEFMDGLLLRRYQKGAKKFPKGLRFIEKAIPLEERDGTFNLVRLIRLLASSGVSEDELYIGMDRAICEEFILPAYSFDTSK